MSVCLCVCGLAGEPAQSVRGTTSTKNALSDLQLSVSMPVCLVVCVSLSV